MLFVKICGVTTVEDALLAASAGAGAIGLNFYPRSVRRATIETAEESCQALPPHLWRGGVFVDAARGEVRSVAERVRLDALQFHGAETPEYCRGWKQRTIKAIRVRDARTLERASEYPVDFILADAYVEGLPGGTGRSIPRDWLAAAD